MKGTLATMRIGVTGHSKLTANSEPPIAGTADVVIAAQQRGLPVSVVWPSGAGRT
ncbi:hypothetical protein [Actinoalloteichus sp. GBA129-24]|uniref:hypothetical protein n=1 Tax=Actinoalloteichus sp. GBA129-24 TaxID=1612551 RepID=UPI0012FCFB35|nr:hypothetical protein [Actinoalloteichus sp. GBA129-24]